MKDLKKASSYLESLGNSGSTPLRGFNALNVGGIFNYYSGVTAEGKKSEFPIRVKPRTKNNK